MKRRRFLGGLVAGGTIWASQARAHGDHGGVGIQAEIDAVRQDGNRIIVDLILTNLGHGEAALIGAETEGALGEPFDAVDLPAGGVTSQQIRLRFAERPPAIFTLLLDFGDAGQGPVVVML